MVSQEPETINLAFKINLFTTLLKLHLNYRYLNIIIEAYFV